MNTKAALIFIVLGRCGTFIHLCKVAKAQISSNQESAKLEESCYNCAIAGKNFGQELIALFR